MNRPSICVVGSLIMDLVFRVERRPGPGETIFGKEFGMFFGGKGFNQAIGCLRLGAHVTMVGRLGDDYFGGLFRKKLAEEGIDQRFVVADKEAGTGVASPVIDLTGQNAIIGMPRANMNVTAGEIEAATEVIRAADVLMLQFEVPVEASRRAAELARKSGRTVILDPAPAHESAATEVAKWPEGLIDYLVPNEVEAQMLLGTPDQGEPEEWSDRLKSMAGKAVVISLGESGAAARDAAGFHTFPATRVKVVDTTGAGDAFRAGLAVMLAEGKSLDEAVRFANACGALATTRFGAEPSMPGREAVEEFLLSQS